MKIGFMGAGAIGCYVGGRLAAAGTDVVLVGRRKLKDDIAAHGLRVTDYRGFDVRLAADKIPFATSPEALKGCDAVIVTVKSFDTAEAARAFRPHLSPGQLVVSLQNGVRNPQVLRTELPAARVLAAMVPFNVVRKDETTFHSGTSGHIVLERQDDPLGRALLAALRDAGIEVQARSDVVAVQWGKLLINLSNAVNALAGVPIREMVSQRPYRRIMATIVAEAVAALQKAGIPAVLNVPLPPALLPGVLRLPNAFFRVAAASMLKIDPHARASMWDDLDRRRRTEIDFLNGEIATLARSLGLSAPVNEAIVALVREAEEAQCGSPGLGAAALGARLGVS